MHKKTTDDGQLSLFEPAEEKIIKQEYSSQERYLISVTV